MTYAGAPLEPAPGPTTLAERAASATSKACAVCSRAWTTAASADTTRTRRTWRAGFHHAWASAPEMDASYLQELRLRAFKSFTDAVLPLDELTLLVERDQLVAGTAIDRVDVWTAEGEISFR